MIKEFINDIKNIDLKIISVMNVGFKVALLILLFASYILTLYSTYPISHIAYLSGLNLFRLSLTCVSAFFICGITVNKLKKI